MSTRSSGLSERVDCVASKLSYKMLLVERVWSLVISLSLILVPTYLKFVVESNSLSGMSMICLVYLSLKRRKEEWLSSTVDVQPSIKHLPKIAPYDIKVLSYNIFLRPPLVKNNADDFKNERLAEFINVINQYDVICLQEMFALANRRQRVLLEAARARGFLYYTESMAAPWSSGKFIDAGLLILSKYPIVAADAYIYRNGNQIDSWAAKQVIYAKIQVSGTSFLHIFNTHLQASYYDSTESHNKLNDFARASQVTEMAAFIDSKTHNSPHPVLVAGDFNINSRETSSADGETEEYRYMMQTLDPSGTRMQDLLKKSYGTHPITYGDIIEQDRDGHVHHVPREVLLTHTADHCCGLSIDYILFGDTPANEASNALQVVSTTVEHFFVDPLVVKCAQLSDHYGVSTTLRVNRSGTR